MYETNHTVWTSIGFNHSLPLLIGAAVCLIVQVSKSANRKLVLYLFGKHEPEDEVLDHYFRSLPKEAKEWILEEEKCCRDKMGFKILGDFAFEQL
jgi:hypothetical protein